MALNALSNDIFFDIGTIVIAILKLVLVVQFKIVFDKLIISLI